MAEARPQAPDIPASPAPQALQQPIQQAQQIPHLTGHILSQNFQENQKKMQKLTYLELMIG